VDQTKVVSDRFFEMAMTERDLFSEEKWIPAASGPP
jgi:hypothetical protein